MHLFLSPHLDDAVLSCGGLIHQLTQSGQSVLVRTIITGDPPSPLPDTPLIQLLHQKWDAGPSPYEVRRHEDVAALQRLDAEWEHMGLLDAPYRTNRAGEALYPLPKSLFDSLHPDDPLLTAQIDVPDTVDVVYAPLGAGQHVDHLVVNRLARQLLNVVYYEEYPYSSDGDEIPHARQDLMSQPYGTATLQIVLENYETQLQPKLIDLSEADIVAKIDAIRCYGSQLGTFWNNEEEMEAGVRRYARQVAATGAERLWIQGDI